MSISWILIIHNIKAPRLINHGFWNGTVWLRWTGPCWKFYVCDQIAVSYNHKAVQSSQPTLNPLTAHGCILILSSPCYLDMFSGSKLSGPEMDGFLSLDLMRARANFFGKNPLLGWLQVNNLQNHGSSQSRTQTEMHVSAQLRVLNQFGVKTLLLFPP